MLCISSYLWDVELGVVKALWRPRWRCRVVREVGMVNTGAGEEEHDHHVEGKHGHREIPAVQQRTQATEQKRAGTIDMEHKSVCL